MTIAAMIILGFILGFACSRTLNRRRRSVREDLTSAVVGAAVGAWLYTTLGPAGLRDLNFYSLLVAVVGAAVLGAAHHFMRRSDRGYDDDATYRPDTLAPETAQDSKANNHHARHNSLPT